MRAVPIVSAVRTFIARPPGLFILFSMWSLCLTYPLIRQPFTAIPLGDEKVGTVPFFNLWTLQWNIDQLVSGYPHYWDAPIFTPTPGTFAFSEPQLLSALLAAPLWLGLHSPAAAYNALVVLFLTLNGWFTCWLLYCWGVARLPACLAGLVAQALPFVTQEIGVLQLIAIFGFLWSYLYLYRFLSHELELPGNYGRQWQNGLGLALGLPVTFFTCNYYGLFSLVFLPLAALSQLRRRHIRPGTVARLAAVAVLALLLTGPILEAQYRRLADQGLSRSVQTIENNSARPGDYGNFLDYNLWYGRLLGLQSGQGQRLFPGLGLVLLAGLGLFDRRHPRLKAYLVLGVILGLVLSLGLRLNLAGFTPYQQVREYFPGFAQLRSPFRFAAMVQIHLVLLAGFGLARLQRHRLILLGAALLTIGEALALPLPLQTMPGGPAITPWQTWLNQQPAPPRIVMLPFAASNEVAAFEQTTRWMLTGHLMKAAMLNGYSGFFPRDHAQVREAMLSFPTPAAIGQLQAKGITYVVVHHGLPGAPPALAVAAYLPVAYRDEVDNVTIYALPPAP